MNIECSPVVLLVEDEWLVREEIADAFRGAGWTVLESSSGEEALALLRGSDMTIDALVTDIQLEGPLTGWDLAEAVRVRYPTIPVVYTSGNSAQDGRLVPGSTFISKPCLADELMDACRKFAGALTH